MFVPNKRRGVTLLIVLSVLSLISLSALTLFYSANLEMMIAGNARRSGMARRAAESGLNHFVALNRRYDALREEASGRESIQVIPPTPLGAKTSYEVKVLFCCLLSERKYIVESTGFYKKDNRVISVHTTKSLFMSPAP